MNEQVFYSHLIAHLIKNFSRKETVDFRQSVELKNKYSPWLFTGMIFVVLDENLERRFNVEKILFSYHVH